MAETLPAKVEKAELGVDVFNPRTLVEAHQLASALYKSGLLPSEIKSAEAAFAILAKGHELGLKPMQSFDLICVIKGKPSLSAAGMRALCLARPDVCEYFRNVETTATKATFETKRRGDPQPVELTFTIEEAKRAGLVRPDSNWSKWPERMLEARASSALARLVYPDLVGGVYTPEEIQEFAPEVINGEVIDEELDDTRDNLGHLPEKPEPEGPPSDMFVSLCGEIADAETGADLDEVVKKHQSAWKARTISEGEHDELKARGKDRRKELTNP